MKNQILFLRILTSFSLFIGGLLICVFSNEENITKTRFNISEDKNEIGICFIDEIEYVCPIAEYEIEVEEIQVEEVEEVFVPYYNITEEDRIVIYNIVAGEAIGESYRCKKLVAECLLNSMRMKDKSASEVRKIYRYDGWMPQAETLYPEAWEDVVNAVSDVFDFGLLEIDDSIEYFYSTSQCYSAWHETLRFVTSEGVTRFFSEYGRS